MNVGINFTPLECILKPISPTGWRKGPLVGWPHKGGGGEVSWGSLLRHGYPGVAESKNQCEGRTPDEGRCPKRQGCGVTLRHDLVRRGVTLLLGIHPWNNAPCGANPLDWQSFWCSKASKSEGKDFVGRCLTCGMEPTRRYALWNAVLRLGCRFFLS
jgi:hypothetical protein